MSNRWPGGIIRKTPVTPAGPLQNGAASGVWSLADAAYWTKQGLWPIAGNAADGTFAIFSLNSARDKYTYAGCVVSAGTAATTSEFGASAAGNTVFGIFAAGSNNTTRSKYTYTSNVVSTATSSTATSFFGSAAGNSTVGIFALGGGTSTRNKYTYSGDVNSAGGAATSGSRNGSAAGNSTVGIFALGCAGALVTTRNKYTYSGDVVSAGTAAAVATNYGVATGNATFGVFALGYKGGGCFSCATETRNKYTYSSDVVATGGAASTQNYAGSAAGNSVVGIFALGQTVSSLCFCAGTICYSPSTTRQKYTYSGCVVSAGAAATSASYAAAAASNGTIGVNT